MSKDPRRQRLPVRSSSGARSPMRIRQLINVVACVAPLGLTGLAPRAALAQPNAAPSARNRQLIDLIDRFFASPLDGGLRSAVIDSGHTRTDIVVELSPSVNPWECYGDPMPEILAFDSTLTAAFVAGNMRPQLEKGRRRDQPGPGVEAVLRVYQVLKGEHPTYHVPEVERWLARDPSGVRTLADSLKHAPVTSCPDDPPRRYRGRVRVRVVPDSGSQ